MEWRKAVYEIKWDFQVSVVLLTLNLLVLEGECLPAPASKDGGRLSSASGNSGI